MSMDPEQQNFEPLCRLLALKRYEQPPPGYFDLFPHQVIARIQALEVSNQDPLLQRLFWQAPWLERVWSLFQTKPLVAGAFGMSVCGLLIVGAVYSEPASSGGTPGFVPLAQVQSTQPVLLEQSLAREPVVSVAGAAPGPLQDSLFQEFKPSQRPWVVQPASFEK